VEIIAFIMEKISSGEMTKLQIINRYGIPKTTLYKWISKYESTEA
jgi:transposase-like protein